MNLEFAKARLNAINSSGIDLSCIDQSLVYDKLKDEANSRLTIFVGEAPGANEAKLGKPFCGIAGANLLKLIEIANLKRDNYYLANAFPFRPLSKTNANRPPNRYELEFGAVWLHKEIDAIKPKMIVALGDKAYNALCQSFDLAMANAFKKLQRHEIIKLNDVLCIARTFHPSPLVYNMPQKRNSLEDFFQKLGGILGTK